MREAFFILAKIDEFGKSIYRPKTGGATGIRCLPYAEAGEYVG